MMRKIFSTSVFFVVFTAMIFSTKKSVQAQVSCTKGIGSNFSISNWPTSLGKGERIAPRTVTFSGLSINSNYQVKCQKRNLLGNKWENLLNPPEVIQSDDTGVAVWEINHDKCWSKESDHHKLLIAKTGGSDCKVLDYKVGTKNQALECSSALILDTNNKPSKCFEKTEELFWKFVVTNNSQPYKGKIYIRINPGNIKETSTDSTGFTGGSWIIGTKIFGSSVPNIIGRTFEISLSTNTGSSSTISSCSITTPEIRNAGECSDEEREKGESGNGSSGMGNFDICKQIPDAELKGKCTTCTGSDNTGIWTAVGCIRADAGSIVQAIMTVGLTVAGGVALLMFLAASFMLSTSQGEPKRTSDAKEMVTSAIIGLIFIVFSVAILQFIGVDILKIPGFGG